MKTINNTSIILIGCLILVIPIGLNFFLQISTPCQVISEQNSGPAIWLVFWGSYLAAIGSCVMAYVAYKQNENIQEQNSYFHEFACKEKEYYDLERLVIEAEQYHCFSQLEKIITAHKVHNSYLVRSLIADNNQTLQSISIKIERFDNSTKESQRYGQALSNINQTYIDLLGVISEIVYYTEGEDDQIHSSEFLDYFYKSRGEKVFSVETDILCDVFIEYANEKLSRHNSNSLYGELMRAGFELLHSKHNEIRNMDKKYNYLCK